MTMPELPCQIECFECGHREWCGEEDPDAGMSQMWNHLYWDHALKSGRSAGEAKRLTGDLLAKVVVVPDA